jgi:hypothetical protein
LAELTITEIALIIFSVIGLIISITHIIRTLQLRQLKRTNKLLERILEIKKLQLVMNESTREETMRRIERWIEEDEKGG